MNRFWQETKGNAVAIAAVLFLLFSMMGVNSSLHALENRVYELDQKVSTLREIETNIRILQEEAKEIGEFRNDILEAIETATRRAAASAARRR